VESSTNSYSLTVQHDVPTIPIETSNSSLTSSGLSFLKKMIVLTEQKFRKIYQDLMEIKRTRDKHTQ